MSVKGPKQSVVEGTHSEYKIKLLHKIFEEKLIENNLHRAAVIYENAERVCRTSFDDLNRKANRLAACMLEILRDANRNLDDDFVIAVCMSTNDNLIATLLAILKTGSAYLPLEPNFPPNRIHHIVNEARPALVICDHNLNRSVFQNVNTISFSELLTKSANCSDDNIHTQNSVSRGDSDIAIILYTSGSTGLPKGVRIPHSAALNKLRWLQQTFPYSPTETVGPLNSALTNVDSVAELWGPLLNGVAVLVIPPEVTKDPSRLVDLLESYKIERLVLVPTLLTSILAYLHLRNERFLTNLKIWICCGETLTTSLAETFFKYFFDGSYRLCNFYGSTEVMGDVTYYVCKSMDELEGLSKVPIGYPLYNTAIFILNDDLSPVMPGEMGEIFVAGLNLAKGYVAGKEKTKFIPNSFTDNPTFSIFYRTGDFGKLIKVGCLQYEGRTDSQIKVHGHRVEILEIEMALRSIEQVVSAVALCYHTGKEDQAVLAFVVLKDDVSELTRQQGNDIKNILRTKLRDFEVPHVLVTKSIPLLPNGKIDRQTLLKQYENSSKKSDIEYDFTGIPDYQLKTAKEVFEIIGNVTKFADSITISAQCNFYELGGNSLNSVLTVSRLRDKGFFIGVTDFIMAECLGDILDKICEEGMVEERLTKFKRIALATHHKDDVILMLSTTFHEKHDLGRHLTDQSNYDDYKDFVEKLWEYLLENRFSFVIMDRDDNVVGININKDGQDSTKGIANRSFGIILEFVDSIELPLLKNMLPQGKNKILYNFLMATSAKLNPRENVEAIQKMEEGNQEIARRNGFVGILATNVSPLTQQLGASIYGYRTLVDYQINQYVRPNGSKPFGKAPDSQRILVQWKTFTDLSG